MQVRTLTYEAKRNEANCWCRKLNTTPVSDWLSTFPHSPRANNGIVKQNYKEEN